MLFVGIFLLALALPSLRADQDNFLTSRSWTVVGNELAFGIAGLLWTTVLSSILAMAMAVPVAIGVALCLTQYLHKRVSGPVSFVVDLLAAVPSIIFGLWGLTILGPFLAPAAEWLISKIGLDTAVQRERRPQGLSLRRRRGAGHHDLADRHRRSRAMSSRRPRAITSRQRSALGATRWEVIRTAVLPYGRFWRDQRINARPGPCARRDHRSHDHPDDAGTGQPLQPLDLRWWRDLCQQDREQRCRVRQPVQDRGLHCGRPGALRVTFAVNAIARIIAERGERSHERDDHHDHTHAQVTFRRPSGVRTVKNAFATVYVTLATVLAIIPLAWVLVTVITKGFRLLLTSDLVAAKPARHHPAPGRRRRLPRDRRYCRDGLDLCCDRGSARILGAISLDRVRQGAPRSRAP